MNQREAIAMGMIVAFILAAAIVVKPAEATIGDSQATSQANDCGNGENPTDILCQNTSFQDQCFLLCIAGDRSTEAQQ